MKAPGIRHLAFIDELFKDMNATQAAIRAGFKPSNAKITASRIMARPDVKAIIAERAKARSERSDINTDYVLKVIRETIERCRQVAPVLDRKGDPVMTTKPDGSLAVAYSFDAIGVLKGTEQLGRHLGMFVEKHEHTGANGGPIETRDVGDLTDDQLLELATGGSAGTADKKARTH